MFEFLKRKYKETKAFKNCFCDQTGKLTKDAEIVLALLRDEACARGELGKDGYPYFYDGNGRFDRDAALFVQGKRRLFDVIVKYLSLDEKEILNLLAVERTKEENLTDNLNI